MRWGAAAAAFATCSVLAAARAEAPTPRWNWTPGAEECASCHEVWLPGRAHDVLGNTPELRRFVPESGALPLESIVSEWELWIDRDPEARASAGCASCHEATDHPAARASSPTAIDAVRVEARTRCVGDRLVVDVEVATTESGHSLPARAWPAALLLRVNAADAAGAPLRLVFGEEQGGFPGKLYARVFVDAFARPLLDRARPERARDVLFDTRLDPGRADTPRWIFAADACTPEAVRVTAQVTSVGASRRAAD